ncbi:hypothetical protein LCM4579_03555 [Ensifer sp. LCM 4579]|nr:hypothetical protein LCM4579_03555 [Ensifer sp. LCM 4579]
MQVSTEVQIMIDNRLTILNTYELKQTPEDFEIAVGALARRVEVEGHSGVLSYRFFVNASERTARGVIDYKDPGAWIGHHEIAMSWPEMTALHAAATLAEVIFLGPLTPEIQAWIERSALTARFRGGNIFAGGFQRPSGSLEE